MLRGLDPPHDPLAPVRGIVDDDCDRFDPLGGTAGGGAPAPRQLGKLVAQIRMHPIEKPCDDGAPFVRREAKPNA